MSETSPKLRAELEGIPTYKPGKPAAAGGPVAYKLSSNENPYPPLPGVMELTQLTLPFGLFNPLAVTAAYTTFVTNGRLPSRDLMARLRTRAFRSGPGVRAATLAISASGRSPHGFAHRPVAFDGPVAAVWGSRDALVPLEHADALRDALPQAHVEIWHGMGHHPQRERPAELAEFIEEHASRGAGDGAPA